MSRLPPQQGQEIVTRSQAIEQGLVKYFTGEQCKHGHKALRYTLNGTCTECLKGAVEKGRENVRTTRERLVAGDNS